jgi:hypothetical protein
MVEVWAQRRPVKARAARAAPARSARNRVIGEAPSIRDGDPGRISAEDRVGLFREIVAVEDEGALDRSSCKGAHSGIEKLKEPRERLSRNGPRHVLIQ